MLSLIQRFYSTDRMLKPEQVLGDLPSTAEAYRNNFEIAWPSALEAVLVSLIGSVDTIMVGVLGPAAISAVGITNQPKFILLAVILSLNVGVTALVARRRGEEDREGANRCLKQSILICILLSLLMSVFGILFAEPIIRFAGASAEVLDPATRYFRIILVGSFFSSVGLTINAAQRGIGNTKISMRTNLTANLVNLIFNYLLIGGHLGFPAWGVIGAGVATTLGNLVGFLMSVRSVLHGHGFLCIVVGGSWAFDRSTLQGLWKVSSSAMVEQVFMRIGFFTYAKLVAGLGTLAFAAHQICMNILNLSFSFGDGFSIAASSLVGQSLGARRPDKAVLYAKVGQRFAFTVSIGLFCLFAFGGGLLASLFTSDPQVLAMSRPLTLVIAAVCLVQVSQVVLAGCLRGAGDSLYVAVVSLVSIALIRPFSSWLLCYPAGWGLVGAWIGLLIDQLTRILMVSARFASNKWTRIKL